LKLDEFGTKLRDFMHNSVSLLASIFLLANVFSHHLPIYLLNAPQKSKNPLRFTTLSQYDKIKLLDNNIFMVELD